MATFLDLSLFGYFGSIFIFIFVFALLFSVLNRLSIFKGVPGEKGVYGLIALSVALIVSVSRDASTIIATMAPWFAILLIFLFLIILMFSMFSGSDTSQLASAIQNPGVYWTLIVLALIIVIASLSSTYGQRLLDDGQGVEASNIDNQNELVPSDVQQIETSDGEGSTQVTTTTTATGSSSITPGTPGSTATGNYGDNFLLTIINPKIMGLIMMMFIAFFTILLIARTPDPD